MSAIALLVAATLAQAGTLRSDLALRGGGAGRSVASLLAMDKGGSQDWGAGIPSPTIDCAAVGTSSSASLQCSGATPAFAGPGQVASGSPWWYRNDTAVRPSIALNGSTDWWDLGDVDLLGDWTACALVSAAGTGNGVVVGKFKTAAYQWAIRAVSGSYAAVAWNAAGDGSALTLGTIVPGSWTVLCASYVRTTQALIGSMNGTASGPITSGATENVTTSLRIGNGETAALWPGSIRRVAIWDGTAFTAAQLAQLVATQWGLAADRPSGTVATHARTDSTLCCPFSDAQCFWLGPGAPCIHAPSYQGWAVAGGIEVYGPGANALAYSETFANAAWVKSAGVSAADADAACPLGPTGVRMSLVTTDGDADQIAQDAATTPGRSVWMARATGDGACGVTFADASGDGAQSVALTDGPVRYYSGGSGQTGLSVARPAGGCARWCMWAAQSTATVDPQPYRASGATPYTYASGTAMAVAPVLNRPALNNRCRTVRACLRTWTGTDRTLWSEGLFATGQVNAARLRLFSNGALWYYINSAEGAQRTLAIAPKFVPGDCHSITACTSGGTQRIYLDRVLIAEGGTGGSGLFSAAPTTSDYIGTQNDASTPLQGVVSSAAVVGSSSIVRSYPYIPENVRVQVIGDSISAAYSVANAYSVRLASLLGRPVDNYAQAGAATDTIRGQHRPTEGQSWLAVLGGINDIVGLNSESGPILANLSAIVAAATSRGTSVVIMTLTPFHGNGTWTPERQAVLEAVNAGIRGMGGGAVHVVDTYAAMGGADPTYLAEEWSHDGLHLNQAGTDRLADLVRGAMP